jgi:hypothetical protein
LVVLYTVQVILYIEHTASKEAVMADIPVSSTSVSNASHTAGLRQVRAEAEETAHISVVWILLQPVT